MAKKDHDRFAALAADIASPRVVPDIDRALAENERERLELLELRKMAVRRHGDTASASADEPAEPAEQEARTMGELVRAYLENEGSPYHKTRIGTRRGYDRWLNRILTDCADRKLTDLNARSIQELYDEWSDGGLKIPTGHGLITMMRMLVNFGVVTLEDNECVRLSVVLRNLHFTPGKPRDERMTEEYAIAIINAAHRWFMPSIALAQALQFECGLRQKDVTGEWVPLNEPGDSVIDIENDEKWLHGVCWTAIDDDWVLRHPPSAGGKDIVVNLRNTSLVKKELERIAWVRGSLPKTGPIIIDERTDLPYLAWRFRRIWREIADEAGVPRSVWNMDSRSSASAERVETG